MRLLKLCVLLLLLAGCAMDANSVQRTSPQGIDVRVSKMDLLQNTYELTPHVGWIGTGSDEERKEALRAISAEVCAPGTVAIMDVERPDYIKVAMSPRG